MQKKPPTKEVLLSLYEYNTITSLAEIFQVSRPVIDRWLRLYEIPVRKIARPCKSVPSMEELKDHYRTKSMVDIGKIYGVSNVTVRKWLNQYGILKRTRSQDQKMALLKVSATKLERHGYAHFPDDLETRKSKAETEIIEWFQSLGYDFKPDRTILEGFELDGYDSVNKKAFEYNGLYWHTELFKDRKYHFDKFKKCESQGIVLYSIFEHEWRDRNSQVKNFLKGSMGYVEKKIYARECKVFHGSTKDRTIEEFCELYHIQGKPSNNIRHWIALEYKGELVSCLVFNDHHRQSGLVLSRYCVKENYSIVGGFRRMLSYVNWDFVTWSDNRFGTGEVYARNGFVMEREYGPDYFYTNYRLVKSKQSMTKKKIGAGKDQTEWERAAELGWFRIWDCGKRKWVFKK